jgi:hypothetical protein
METAGARIRTYALLPRVRAPIPAQQYRAAIPKLARQYCLPAKAPLAEGCLFFPLFDFDFRANATDLDVRYTNESGEVVTVRVSEPSVVVTVPQVSRSWDTECAEFYESRLASAETPKIFSKTSYPDTLLAVFLEEGSYYLQVWLGLTVMLSPGDKLWMKEPAATQFVTRGYHHLDAIVESDRWYGYLASVIRPTIKGEWLSVRASEPICQGLIYRPHGDALAHMTAEEVPQEVLLNPLQWHKFDPRYAAPPGKYQRQMNRPGNWDCTWKNSRSELSPQTRLRLFEVPIRVERETDSVTLHFHHADLEIQLAPSRFAEELERGGTFTVEAACDWICGEDSPPQFTADEVVGHLKELLDRGLLVVVE